MTAISVPRASAQARRAARRTRRRVPLPVAIGLLPLLFGAALLAPIPSLPNSLRAEVIESVATRLPGWDIVRTRSSWEGAWTVVAACGTSRIGFQLVPGHGLNPGDAWLHPEDVYTRTRLASTSDDYRFLVWLGEPARPRSLSCAQELANNPSPRAPIPLD